MESYDFDGDLNFKEFLKLIVGEQIEIENDHMDGNIIELAKSYYFKRCVQKEVSTPINGSNHSTHEFFRQLASNPNIEITKIPGYMPPRDIPQDLYQGVAPDIVKVKSPPKPWESL